jgi:hypothetical protein
MCKGGGERARRRGTDRKDNQSVVEIGERARREIQRTQEGKCEASEGQRWDEHR